MILKNIINYFNLIELLCFLLFIYVINSFLVESNIRNKFFLFIVNLLIFLGIGFYYNLDGLMMLFFISELTIILIFIVLFSQLYTYYKNKNNNNKFFFLFLVFVLNFNYYEVAIINYNNFYSYSNVVLNDFYYIYNSYFEKHILLVFFTLFIITLYSIFFILLYYNLKQLSNIEFVKKKNLFYLRKQSLLHQSNYNTKIRVFKKKN